MVHILYTQHPHFLSSPSFFNEWMASPIFFSSWQLLSGQSLFAIWAKEVTFKKLYPLQPETDRTFSIQSNRSLEENKVSLACYWIISK